MNYYRKTVDNVVDNVKFKMQMGALTLKLNENNGNISSNLTKINTNTSDISSNLTKINTNTSDISSNLSKINTNTSHISSNLSKINTFEENNLKIPDEVFNNTYDIINQSFNFNENTHSYLLFEKIIENNMSSGELIISTIINYKYDNLENDINRLTHLYQFYDDKDELIYSITLDNHDFGVKSNSDLIISDNFCFNINNKNNIKLVLSLTRINEWGTGSINLEMIDNNSINIIYKEKTPITNIFDKIDTELLQIKRKTDSNNNLIQNNFVIILPLKSNYVIDNILLFNLDFIKDINFKSDIKKILAYENNINYQFKIGSFVELNESLVYQYEDLKFYYFVLKETHIILDQNDVIIEEFSFNIKSKGMIFRNLFIYNNQYYFKIISNITNLKIRLYLERINPENDMEFNLKLTNQFQNNYICLKYFKYTS